MTNRFLKNQIRRTKADYRRAWNLKIKPGPWGWAGIIFVALWLSTLLP